MGIEAGETEFDLGIGCLWPGIVLIGIQSAEVRIQHVELGLNLGIRNVFRRARINDVEHHGNGHHSILVVCPLLGHNGGPVCGMVFNLLLGVRVFLQAHHLDVLLMGMAGPLGGDILGHIV